MATQIAVWTALTGFAGMMIFQALLALGVPWGKAAWGGTHRKLPVSLRIGSLIAIGIYLFGGLLILEKIGLVRLFNSHWPAESGIWILSGIFALSFVGNILSQSKLEKMIMIPVSAALCLSCAVIAWNL